MNTISSHFTLLSIQFKLEVIYKYTYATLTHMNAFINAHANEITHKYGDTFATHVLAHSLYAFFFHILVTRTHAHTHAYIKDIKNEAKKFTHAHMHSHHTLTYVRVKYYDLILYGNASIYFYDERTLV